jgi:protease IV
VQERLEYVYAMFKDRVRQGRDGQLTEELEQIAGGRVYTGRQALELGLVDQLGGLSDAIAHVAAEAGLDEYALRRIPEQRNFLDMMIRQMTGQAQDEEGGGVSLRHRMSAGHMLAGWLFERPEVRSMLEALGRVDPHRARAIARILQRVELLGQESMLAVLEWEFILR